MGWIFLDGLFVLHFIVEAMLSKVILMMPKNQELSKFQRFKNQVSRIKIQDSRIIKVKIQDSRFKNQEKT